MKKHVALMILTLLFAVGTANAVPVLFNGHYYENITNSGMTWDEANTAANAMTYNGMQGHLVTITSREENLFLTNDASLGDGRGVRL
jgi:hypothetical protein